MTLQQFVASKKKFWDEIAALINRFQNTSLNQIDESEIQRLSFLYRLVCSDLAFARSHYAGQSVTGFLNDLVSRSHPYLYQRRGFHWRDVKKFFLEEYPALCRRHASLFGVVAALFVVTALLGSALSFLVPEMENVFLSPDMIAGLREGKLWTESIFSVMPSGLASARILTNNISVTFLTFALGVTVIGTLYLLIINGLMLGVILTVCYQYQMMTPILSFVSPHGFIEITAILFSGTAGLMIGKAWMDPGEMTRGDSLREAGGEAVRMVVGMVPVLVIAGVIEGFISPRNEFGLWMKLGIGLTLAALLYAYCFLKRATKLPAA